LRPFFDAFRLRIEREHEQRSSEIDIIAWSVGRYVREAVVSSFNAKAKYPVEPMTIHKHRMEQMTGKDHADQFREFLKHYKRPPVKGGEK